MIINSDTVVLNKSQQEVYDFLADMNNFKRIMPEQVEKWTSTVDACHFTVKGMASLGLKVEERKPHSTIVLSRNGNAPFEYTITCHIKEEDLKSSVQMIFESDMNMMLKMMVERPLTNFLNMLVHNLEKSLTAGPYPKEGRE